MDAAGQLVEDRLIFVAVGTYVPTSGSGRAMTYTIPNGTRMFGGFTEQNDPDDRDEDNFPSCVLSGDIGSAGVFTDNSYHVVTVESGENETRIDGFKIEKGNANGTTGTTMLGGGVFCEDTDLTLYNLYFEQNVADFGGGVYYSGGSDGDGFRLYRGWFSNNVGRRTGGGIHLANLGIPNVSRITTPSLEEPSWIYNSTFSRCLAGTNGSPTLATDGGAAIYVANRQELAAYPSPSSSLYSTLVVYNSQFFDNYVYGGGAAVRIEAATTNGGPTFWSNCTMAYNVVLSNAGTNDSGTLWMESEVSGKESWMVNSICQFTLAGSGGSASGTAIEGPGSASTLGTPMTAGTFWAVSSNIDVLTGTYSNGGSLGCIDADPEFLDATNFDLALDPTGPSPCINTGNNGGIFADLPDMDNDMNYNEAAPFHVYVSGARLVSTVDMGCFEDQ